MKRVALFSVLALLPVLCGETTAQCEIGRLTPSDGAGGDQFGFWLAVDGGTSLVGAFEHGDGGAAYVYVHQDRGTADPWDDAWVELAQLHGSLSTGDAAFGTAVALYDGTAVVGAPREGVGGAAYVFERDDRGTLDPLDDTWVEVARLAPAMQSTGDQFGARVTLYADTLVVAAYSDDERGVDAGAVHVFERDPQGVWVETAKLFSSDAAAGDEFGLSPSLSGDTFIVGARYDEDNGPRSGSGFVFERDDGGTPANRLDDTWVQTAKLHPGDARAYDYFAQNTTLFEDTAIFSKHFDDDACSGSSSCESGAAYVFERDDLGTPDDRLDDRWIQTAKLVASDGHARDYLGLVPFLRGNRALLSANGVDGSGQDSGAVYSFERDDRGTPGDRFDDVWVESAKLSAHDARGGDELGYGLALEGSLAVVGARFDDGSGSARVFDLDLACPAGVVPRPGSGINAGCFTPVDVPRLGGTWSARIDTLGHPGARISVVLGVDTPLRQPLALPMGELLIDLPGGNLFLRTFTLSSPFGADVFSYAIPPSTSLAGLRVFAQGAILGGAGPEFCNALDVILGL